MPGEIATAGRGLMVRHLTAQPGRSSGGSCQVRGASHGCLWRGLGRVACFAATERTISRSRICSDVEHVDQNGLPMGVPHAAPDEELCHRRLTRDQRPNVYSGHPPPIPGGKSPSDSPPLIGYKGCYRQLWVNASRPGRSQPPARRKPTYEQPTIRTGAAHSDNRKFRLP